MNEASKPLEIWRITCGHCDKKWLAKRTGDAPPAIPSHPCTANSE